jgi:transposase
MTCYGQWEVAMSMTKLNIEWQEDEATLFRVYRSEPEADLRIRWHALWLVRQGYSVRQAARLVGVHLRTLRRWLAWYRQGGIERLKRHRVGNRQGRESYLTPEQEAQLVCEAAKGTIPTIKVAVEWVKEHFGVSYTYWGMRHVFQRLNFKKKVPRPLAKKASLEVQESWKKGDLRAS